MVSKHFLQKNNVVPYLHALKFIVITMVASTTVCTCSVPIKKYYTFTTVLTQDLILNYTSVSFY